MSAVQLHEGITLLSGTMFDYHDPSASIVQLDDIAGALSKVCRFSGHINRFYSVAQHAVNVSRIVQGGWEFTALMHDTAEAFTNDITTPLKAAVPAFKQLEERIEAAMACQFGFTYPLPDEVKLADLQMLKIEKERFKPNDRREWAILDGIEIEAVLPLVDLSMMTAEQAEDAFIDRYMELLSPNDGTFR